MSNPLTRADLQKLHESIARALWRIENGGTTKTPTLQTYDLPTEESGWHARVTFTTGESYWVSPNGQANRAD